MVRNLGRNFQRPSTVLAFVFVLIPLVSTEEYRLPTTISPISYDVKLHPNYPTEAVIDVTDFDGSVEITATVNTATEDAATVGTTTVEVAAVDEATADTTTEDTATVDTTTANSYSGEIFLHAGNHITVHSVRVTDITDGTVETTDSIDCNVVTEICSIHLINSLTEGHEIQIFIAFSGKLEDDMLGFYKSTYTVKDSQGKEEHKMLLTTQFQSTHARKAFPCFDEPKFKATFTVTLGVPNGYGALSNTEVESATSTEIKFRETVKMSTYLLAFIIYEEASFGPSIRVLGTDSVRFTSWGRISAMDAHLGDYSQTITHRILSELDEFTGIPYSRDNLMMKVDQAAIPDFSSGAMENWGLVTYRETGLLFDEVNNTEATRKSVAAVIAHELTHQWFGNLVTLDWWSLTWLNEGFARYFQYFILNNIYPHWRMLEQFVVDQQMNVFATDSLAGAVPLFRDVETPNAIDGQFSSTVYSKGGSVVRLLNIVLGPEYFQKGLQQYLNDREFDTATAEQLFESLDKHKPSELEPENLPDGFVFTDLIKWSTTPGYPLVTFTRDGTNTKLTIKQERFFLDGTIDTDQIIYPVYLEWSTSDHKHTKLWLVEKEASSSEALPKSDDDWFVVNNTGYFRVNYDVQNWRNIYIQLTNDLERIAPLDRATLLDNALNLARVDEMSYQHALTFLRYLQNETDYIPWTAAFSGLSFLHRMLVNVDELGTFNSFVETLLEDVYEYLGFHDRGDHLEKIQRASALSWACRVGVEDCQTTAVDLLTAYVDEGKRVPANLRSVAYCYGIKNGHNDLWLKMWQKLQENEDASERSLLISALGCSKSYSTLYMYLEQSLSGEEIRQQDAVSVFSSVYTNPEGIEAALDFLVENFERIENTYVTLNAVNNIVSGVANYLTKADQRAKMQKLVDDNPESLENIAKSALATIDTNLNWLTKYKDEVLTTMSSLLSKERRMVPLW